MYLATTDFGSGPGAGGWSSFDVFPRRLGDVNGDRVADIVGFGNNGTFVALGNGAGGFGPIALTTGEFGRSTGWASFERFPRQLGDVNGDGRSDVVGFGANGTYVALANQAGGFGPIQLATADFGASSGWTGFDRFPRFVSDVNGDGRADVTGFGNNGTYVAFGLPNGTFGPAGLATLQFGAGAEAGGWTSYDRFPRRPADVNGDGRDDLVGFGDNGVFVALGNGLGGFGPAVLGEAAFGASPSAGSWTSFNSFPRRLGDVNGDGRADVIGFGNNGTFVSLGEFDAPGQFQDIKLAIASFGAAPAGGGWGTYNAYPRELSEVTADVNGDRVEDIIGFGEAGTYVALGNFSGTFV